MPDCILLDFIPDLELEDFADGDPFFDEVTLIPDLELEDFVSLDDGDDNAFFDDVSVPLGDACVDGDKFRSFIIFRKYLSVGFKASK